MANDTDRSRSPRSPRLKLAVDDALIEDALPRDSSHCMLAEAVKSAYPDASRVAVDLQTIRFSDLKKGYRYTYLTPRLAQVALIQFDQGIRPEPFSVTLRGGQVTLAGSRQKRLSKPLSDAQIAQRVAAGEKGNQALGNRGRLSKGDRERNGEVPDKIGGRTPPTTPFSRRRAFGLRQLEL